MTDIMKDITPLTMRDHNVSPQHDLDRVKLNVQKGPLGSIDREDAAFIIRAVNSYQPMLSALEALVDRAVEVWKYSPDYVDIAVARKAIALAKGETQ